MGNRFNDLKQVLPDGSVVLPGDDTYDDLLQRWSATCVKPAVGSLPPLVPSLPGGLDHSLSSPVTSLLTVPSPYQAVIVFPSTTAHVSTAISYANAHAIHFNACCGGHSTSGHSAAPSPDEMVIDL